MNKIDLLIFNSSELLTISGKNEARTGKDLNKLSVIKNGAIAVNDGIILETGNSKNLLEKYSKVDRLIDAENCVVMPGFVDCHTHLVYGGSRESEMAMRLEGISYLEILKQGGGIHSTVKATREISKKDLKRISIKKLDKLLKNGTTTVEIKSGYGLDYVTEKKILEIINELNEEHLMDIIPTFLGAHTIPKDVDRNKYINWIVEEAIPRFRDLAKYCDVFCEDGAFSIDETKRIFSTAIQNGYKLKIHSGQFNDLGASGLAAHLRAVSADHLENISVEQIRKMKKNGTIAVLLPGVPFYLQSQKYANARLMIKEKLPIAIATDYNPGSCPSYSMQMMITLACLNMNLTIEEAIIASTINSAAAIEKEKVVGSLEKGKHADIIILDLDNYKQIPYYFGTNLIKNVVKNGIII
ncbi:MAG: imidazolonepropionase [Candidatus Marinimicrobia bacterium]|jgi:imidazolonepropionase|nr:imidazolonepropionase [Candidatus Neomarinimicrobiota bacterium]